MPRSQLFIQAILTFVLVLGQIPPSLPATNPTEKTMIFGHEDPPIVDDDWVVPRKFYRLSKVKMWKNNANTRGFEVTFSVPVEFTGWADETHMYGFPTETSALEEIPIDTEVVSMEICAWNGGGNPHYDFEGLRFTEEDTTFQEISPDCTEWISQASFVGLNTRLIGFHVRTGYYQNGDDNIRSIAIITDSTNCEELLPQPDTTSSPVADMTTIINTPVVTQDISALTANTAQTTIWGENGCGSVTKVLQPSVSFITLSLDENTLSLQSTDVNDIGMYTFTLTVAIVQTATTEQVEVIYTFLVSVTHCDSSTFSYSALIADTQYILADPTLTLAPLLSCGIAPLTYSEIVSPAASFLTFTSPSDCSLDVTSSNIGDVGLFTIQMIATVLAIDNGSVPDLTIDFTFTIRVVGCTTSSFVSTSILDTEFELGTPALTLSSDPLPFCNSVPIQYSAVFTPAAPSSITFDNGLCSITVESINISDVNLYSIQVTATVLAADNGSVADLTTAFTFTIQVVVCTAGSFEFSTPIPDSEYEISDPALTLSPSPLPFCNGVPIQYSAVFTPAAPSSITFDDTTCSIIVDSNDSNDVNLYFIQVTATVLAADNGSVADLTTAFTFTIRVVGCTADSFEFSTPIPDSEYEISDPALTLSPSPLPFCNGVPIQYSAVFTPAAPSSITFDDTTCSIIVDSNDSNDANLYSIQVIATVLDADNFLGEDLTSEFTFDLIVTSNSEFTIPELPYFVQDESKTLQFTIDQKNMTERIIINLPEAISTCGTQLTYFADQTESQLFTTFNQAAATITVLHENVADAATGTYEIEIYVIDDCELQSSSLFLTLILEDNSFLDQIEQSLNRTANEITGQIKTVEIDESNKNALPTAKIKSIDQFGLVHIQFSKEMYIEFLPNENSTSRSLSSSENCYENATLSDFWTCIKDEKMKIEVIQVEGYNNIRDTSFNWTVIEYTKTDLYLQLAFNQAVFVSSNAEPDYFRLEFITQDFFYNGKGLPVKMGSTLAFDLQSQFQLGSTAAHLAQYAGTAQQSSELLFTSNVIVNTLLTGSANSLWSLINSQQIIIMLPLYDTALPPNANIFFQALMQICAFDPIDLDEFWHEHLQVEETEAIGSNFATIGYESKWFIINLGSFAMFIVMFPTLYLLLSLLNPCKQCRQVGKMQKWLNKNLLWNSPLRLMIESYLVVLIPALINLHQLKWESYGEIINSGLSLAYIVTAVLIPILLYRFLRQNRTVLNQDRNLQRYYGTLFEELQTKPVMTQGVIQFACFYFIRRFLVAFSVVMMNHFLVGQFFFFVLCTIAQVIFLGLVKPYKVFKMNNNEMSNEVLTMMIMYHIFCFTDWIQDERLRFNLGYSCLMFNIFHLGLNMYHIMKSTVKDMLIKMRIKFAFYRFLKYQRPEITQKFKGVGRSYLLSRQEAIHAKKLLKKEKKKKRMEREKDKEKHDQKEKEIKKEKEETELLQIVEEELKENDTACKLTTDLLTQVTSQRGFDSKSKDVMKVEEIIKFPKLKVLPCQENLAQLMSQIKVNYDLNPQNRPYQRRKSLYQQALVYNYQNNVNDELLIEEIKLQETNQRPQLTSAQGQQFSRIAQPPEHKPAHKQARRQPTPTSQQAEAVNRPKIPQIPSHMKTYIQPPIQVPPHLRPKKHPAPPDIKNIADLDNNMNTDMLIQEMIDRNQPHQSMDSLPELRRSDHTKNKQTKVTKVNRSSIQQMSDLQEPYSKSEFSNFCQGRY